MYPLSSSICTYESLGPRRRSALFPSRDASGPEQVVALLWVLSYLRGVLSSDLAQKELEGQHPMVRMDFFLH